MARLAIKEIILGLLACLLVAANFPRPTGHVNDFAGILGAGERSQLEGLARQLKASTGVELAVVTMNLAGESIEDAATRLYAEWGIGKKGVDDGALVLMAPDIHEVRIEIGYGIEGIVPDAAAGRIIREVMIPSFREGLYATGLKDGVTALIVRIANGRGAALEGLPVATEQAVREGDRSYPVPAWLRILFLLLAAYLFIRHPRLFLLFMMMQGGGGGGRGGFRSGGFGGFGGGLSGGGGASGRW